MNQISKINVGDVIYDIRDKSRFIEITYDELVSLRDNKELIAGSFYRITDYITTTSEADTKSAEHPFDIIVVALNENTLSEEAYAIQSERDVDGYFSNCNLAAWKIKYCLDNDTSKFKWAFNIDIPYTYDETEGLYQFDNWIRFEGNMENDVTDQSFYLDRSEMNELISHFGYEVDSDGVNRLTLYGRGISGDLDEQYRDDGLKTELKYYYIGEQIVDGVMYNVWLDYQSIGSKNTIYCLTEKIASNNKILSHGKGVIYYMKDEYGNECSYDFKNIMYYHDERWYYTFGETMDEIVLGNPYDVVDNIIKEYMFQDRILGLNHIILKRYCRNNTFESGCSNISLDRACNYNTFDMFCNDINFNFGCSSNVLGSHCKNIIFDYGCKYNKFGNGCESNTLKEDCSHNIFGDMCNNNTLNGQCNYNKFGGMCSYNTLDANNIQNIFSSDCWNNQIAINCQGNTFGVQCNYNILGSNSSFNTFGNKCLSNKFMADVNGTVGAYHRFNIFGDNVQNCTLINETSASINNQVQYYNIRSGVNGKTINTVRNLQTETIIGGETEHIFETITI